MPLESLLQLVETLRERIHMHGHDLEIHTRYALVDPLLRELGWDTSDPAMVVPEYRSGTGKADYALLNNGKPVMMVEAKKLGTPLRDDVLAQGINYCLMEGTNHFAVTDGAIWEVYETHRPVPIDQKRIVSFNLSDTLATETCLKALALWRPSVQAGQVVTGQAPILNSSSEIAVPTTSPQTLSKAPEPGGHKLPVLSQATADDNEWRPLPDWRPVQGDGMPVEVMFPDRSCASINRAYDIVVESVRWLITRKLLTAASCPIQNYSGKVVLMTDSPDLLPGGRSDKKKVDRLYVGVKYNGHLHVRNARAIIQHVGQDPAQFKVRFS